MNFDTGGIEAALERVGATLITWGPRIAAAIAILVVTHFIAKMIENGVKKIGVKAPWKKGEEQTEANAQIWSQAAKLCYWLLWLFGFLIALQPLQLGAVVSPLNSLLNEIGAFLPNLIGALVIFVVGIALSKIMRGIAENAVGMFNVERFLVEDDAKLAEQTKVRSSIAIAAGVAAQVLVLLPISLAAIDVLGINAVTEPLRAMLAMILVAVPHVIAAALVLVLSFILGRWIASAAESFLEGVGVDRTGEAIGLTSDKVSLSRIAYHVVLLAVMLFAFIEAARLLDFAVVSQIADEVVRLGGRIVFGAVVILAGFLIARIAGKLIADNGDARLARIASLGIIALSIAMGLTFMGIASEIVGIAFGAMLGAVAIAAAIAFGLGGRETAHELLQEWKKDRPAK